MINIKSELDIIIQAVKAKLPMFSINQLPNPNVAATPPNPPTAGQDAFQIYNGQTTLTFVYGFSAYGGNNVLIKPTRRKIVSSSYLYIK